MKREWMRYAAPLAAIGLAIAAVSALGSGAMQDLDALQFEADGRMKYPADYRSWVYLSSGRGMSYNEAAQAQPHPPFDNVFVNRSAWRTFLESGKWPDGTAFMLEIRASSSKGSILTAGSYQTDQVFALEAHVKDKRRFGGDGWAFFEFEEGKPAKVLERSAACYACHEAHGAVDTTFVQFYPTLLPIARTKNTIDNPGEIQ